MEPTPNLPVIARRIWSIVRVVYFMLRKGISKRKLMVDLNMMMKRGKIAGKAIGNLMFHHPSASSRRSHDRHLPSFTAPLEYEFSCSNSPAFPYHFPFHISSNTHNKRKTHAHSHFFSCTHAPATHDHHEDIMTVNAVKKVLEMLNSNEGMVEASPMLPGFGRSPAVRQLRITDSPFPLKDIDEDNHVDEAAEEFIMKFYNELKQQKIMAALGSY